VSPFDVRKSVHHHTIQIIQPTSYNSFTSLLLDVYVWLDMFRASPRPSSGAYNCTRNLWFYRWREAAGALLVVVWQPHINISEKHVSPFNVRKSVHHYTIQIIQPTSFTSLLLDVYVWLIMFRTSPRPSSGAYNALEVSGFTVGAWR
jgi:hypothetical protein